MIKKSGTCFINKYNGYEIKRYWRGDRCTNTELDIYLRAINLVVIPPLEEIDYVIPALQLEAKRLYVSKYDTLRQFKDNIAEIAGFLYNTDLYGKYDRIRLWKYDSKKFEHDDAFLKWINQRLAEHKNEKESFEFEGQNIDIYEPYKIKDIAYIQGCTLVVDFVGADGLGIF